MILAAAVIGLALLVANDLLLRKKDSPIEDRAGERERRWNGKS
jgi:hypothetical protein